MKTNMLYNEDCLVGMKKLPDNSIDLIATDPPYGISFMGKRWDRAIPSVNIWKESLRVLKPGAFAFVMCIPRQDCLSRMIISLEDAGFNVNFSSIYWTFSSGFPKASNIGKMVDKRGGKYLKVTDFSKYIKNQRENKGITLKELNKIFGYVAGCNWWEAKDDNFRVPNNKDYKKLKELLDLDDRYDFLVGAIGEKIGETIRGNAGFSKEQVPRPWKEMIGESIAITLPSTSAAKALNGSYSGFQMKPAVEVILVAMKPLSEKTYVDQTLKNRKGITWQDDCRIPYESEEDKGEQKAKNPHTVKADNAVYGDYSMCKDPWKQPQGRFPANLICGSGIDINIEALLEAKRKLT